MLQDRPIIIADESVDARILKALTDNGYAIYSITQECPGITDNMVIKLAEQLQGFILTEDKDFGDELVYKRTRNVGSMLLRLSDVPIVQRTTLVVDTFRAHLPEMLHHFSVLTAKKLRIRRYS